MRREPTDKPNKFGLGEGLVIFGILLFIVVTSFRYSYGTLNYNCDQKILEEHGELNLKLIGEGGDDEYYHRMSTLRMSKLYSPGNYLLVISNDDHVLGIEHVEIKDEEIIELNIEDLIDDGEIAKQHNREAKASIN